MSDMMMQGKLVRMEGQLLADLNKGTVKANEVVRDCMNTKVGILSSLITATMNSGLAQSIGQEITGAFSIAGGAAGVAGGFVGMYEAAGELADLNKIGTQVDRLEAEASAARPGVSAELEAVDAAPAPQDDAANGLSEQDKALEQEKVHKDWEKHRMVSTMLMQAVTPLAQGCGQIASAPLTATASAQQAQSQKAQALQETANSQMGSTEGAVQNAQGFFGQTAQLPGQSCQWMVILAQAH